MRNGNQGNSGYTGAAGELEVVNNLTQGGATSALSAEMGKLLRTLINEGYQYAGMAQADTVPGIPDKNVFYIAGPGEYPGFSRTINDGRIGVLKWVIDGWSLETITLKMTFSGHVGFQSQNDIITPSSLPQFKGQSGVITFLNGAPAYLWVCLGVDGYTAMSNGIDIPMTFFGMVGGLYCYVSDEKINAGTIKIELSYKGIAKSDDERLTITARSYEITYGDAMPSYSFYANGEVEGTPFITCAANPNSGVGVYPIIISQGTVTDDNAAFVNGTLTIKKATLTVKANDAQVAVGGNMPEFNVSYEGFVNDEDESVLTTLPTCVTDAQDTSTEDEYTITPSGAEADNYTFEYVPGTLTVGDPRLVSWTSSQLHSCSMINGYIDISQNVWKTSSSYQGVLINVLPFAGNKIIFTRSSTWEGVRYAFLRAFGNSTITNNLAVSFSQIQGYTAQITNTTDVTFEETIPSDAVYMYVYVKSANINTAPDLVIKGHRPAQENFNLAANLFTANKTIGTDGTVYTGASTAPNNWATTASKAVHTVSHLWKINQILNTLPSGFSDLYIGYGLYSASKQWIRRVGYDVVPTEVTLTPDVCFINIIMYGHDSTSAAIPISSVPIDGDNVQLIGTDI